MKGFCDYNGIVISICENSQKAIELIPKGPKLFIWTKT